MNKLLLVFYNNGDMDGCLDVEQVQEVVLDIGLRGPDIIEGTRTLLKDAHLPYYQCVDENNKGNNLKERKYL